MNVRLTTRDAFHSSTAGKSRFEGLPQSSLSKSHIQSVCPPTCAKTHIQVTASEKCETSGKLRVFRSRCSRKSNYDEYNRHLARVTRKRGVGRSLAREEGEEGEGDDDNHDDNDDKGECTKFAAKLVEVDRSI